MLNICDDTFIYTGCRSLEGIGENLNRDLLECTLIITSTLSNISVMFPQDPTQILLKQKISLFVFV